MGKKFHDNGLPIFKKEEEAVEYTESGLPVFKKKSQNDLTPYISKPISIGSQEVAKPLSTNGTVSPVGGEEYSVDEVISSYKGKTPIEAEQPTIQSSIGGGDFKSLALPEILDEKEDALRKKKLEEDTRKGYAAIDRISNYGKEASRRKLYFANEDERQVIKDNLISQGIRPDAVDNVMNTIVSEYKKEKDSKIVSSIKQKTKQDITNNIIRKSIDSEKYTPQIFRNDTPDIVQPLGFKPKQAVTYKDLTPEDKKKVEQEVNKEYAAKIDMKLWSILSDDDKKLATNNTKQQSLVEKLKDENLPTEQRNSIREQLISLEKERSLLGAKNRLYDPISGNYVDKDKANDEIVAFNNTVQQEQAKLSDKGITKQIAEDNILRLEGIENKINENVGGFYTKMKYKDLWDFGRLNVATNPNMKLSDWEYAQTLKKEYLDAKAKAYAVAHAIETNQDPSEIKRGLFTEAGVLDAFEKGVMGGLELEHKLEEQEEGAIATEFVNAVNEAGQQGILTKAQVENAKETFTEKGAYGAGATLPIVGEIALSTLATEGVGGVLQIAKYAPRIKTLFNSEKAANLFTNVLKETARGYATFAPTSLEGTEGIGEGFAQGVMSSVLPENLLKGKYGRILEFGMRVGAGTTAEFAQEYGGQYIKALKDNGYDMDVAFEQTIGRTPEEAWEKALLIGTQSLMFSGTFNAKILYSTKAFLETKVEDGTIKGEEKEAVEEVIKKSNEKLASEPSMVTLVDNNTGAKTIISEDELTAKIDDKEFLKSFVNGEVQVNINENEELVTKLEEASTVVAKEIEDELDSELEKELFYDSENEAGIPSSEQEQETIVEEQSLTTPKGNTSNVGIEAGSVGVGGDVESKKSEIEKLNNEIDSFDKEYNSLVDIVNKEDRKLNSPKSENEIKLNKLQDKLSALIDKRIKIEQSLKETTKEETTKPIIDETGTETTAENRTTDIIEDVEIDEVELAKRKKEFEDAKTKELQSLDDNDYVNQFIEDGHLNPINSKRDFLLRPDFQIPTKDIQKGIDDIKLGKNSAAARNLKAAILETKRTGVIPMIQGTGGTTVRTGRNIGSLYTINNEEVVTPQENIAFENLSPTTKSAVADGITLENIDSFKEELFDGFPYTEEDFINIKEELEYEKTRQTSDVETKGLSKQGEGEQGEKTDRERAEERLRQAKEDFRKSGGLSSGGLQNLEQFVNLVAAYVNMGIVEVKDIINRIKLDHKGDVSEEQVNKALSIIEADKKVGTLVKEGRKPKEAVEEVYNELTSNGANITSKEFKKSLIAYNKEKKKYAKVKERLEAEKEVADLFNQEPKEVPQEEIQTLLQGIRLGTNSTKAEIKQVQDKVIDYAKKVLPNTNYAKREFSKIFTTIKKSQSDKDIKAAIKKVDEIAESVVRRKKIAELQKNMKIAAKNLKTKHGSIYEQVKALLSLKDIPNELFSEYEAVMKNLSERTKIIEVDVEAVNNLYDKIVDKLEVVDNSLTDEEVAEKKQESLEKAVANFNKAKEELSEIENFSIEEIAKLLKTQDHKLENVNDKSIDEIKDITENLKKIKALNEIIEQDDFLDFDNVDFGNKDTDTLALRFINLPMDYLATLPAKTINNVATEMRNISRGYISNKFASDTIADYNAEYNKDRVFTERNIFDKKGKEDSFDTEEAKQIREEADKLAGKVDKKVLSRMLNHIDRYTKSIGNTAIYETIVSTMSRALGAKEKQLSEITDTTNNLVRKALIKRLGSANYKARIGYDAELYKLNVLLDVYRIERQHQTNPNSKTAPSIIPLIDKLIKNRTEAGLKAEDVEVLNEIKDSLVIKDGKVDLEALEKSLSKEDMDIIKYMDEQYNGRLGEIAEYTMKHINGESFEMYDNYTPLPAYNKGSDLATEENIDSIIKQSTLRPKTKSGSTKGRVVADNESAAKLTRLGAVSNFLNYTDGILNNYHIAPAKRLIDKTLDKISKEGNESSDMVAKVLKRNMNLNLIHTINRNSSVLSPQNKTLKFLMNNVAKKLLISISRATKDISNFIVSAPLLGRTPKQIKEAVNFNKSGAYDSIISEFGTSQAGRTRGAYTQDISSTNLSKAFKGGLKTSNPKFGDRAFELLSNNMITEIGDFASKKYYRFIDAALPLQQRDKFLSHFKKITGQDFDSDKYMNDKAYKAKYYNEIARSMAVADKHISDIYNTVSNFEQKMKGKDADSLSFWNMIGNFMQSFTFNEQSTLFTAGESVIGKGSMNKTEAATKLATLISRLAIYDMVGGMTYRLLKEGIPDDDEEGTKQLNKMINDTAYSSGGNFLMLLLAGNAPAWAKNALGAAANYTIDEVTERLTGKKKDKDDTSLFYEQSYDKAEDVIRQFGAMGEVINTFVGLAETTKKTLDKLEEKKKSGKEITEKDLVELRALQQTYGLLSTLFGFPLYKDAAGLQRILEREYEVSYGKKKKPKKLGMYGGM